MVCALFGMDWRGVYKGREEDMRAAVECLRYASAGGQRFRCVKNGSRATLTDDPSGSPCPGLG